MAGPVAISVQDVSKRFVIRKDKNLKERVVNPGRSRRHKEDFWALRDVSFDIVAGSSVGLIGANGSGKSTLLKTIGGIIAPTSGAVLRRGRLAALLELGAGFHGDLTGRENVFLNGSILGLSQRQVEQHLDAIVDFSGVRDFIDTQVKFYSSGMYVRLAFAVAVHVDPDVLLVDEVLAVGDEPFQRKCMDHIRTFQSEARTIVLVTHSLEQMIEVCDRALVLDHGRLAFDGAPINAARELRREFEVARLAERRSPSDASANSATVQAVTVTGADGLPKPTVRVWDGFHIRVIVVPDCPLTDWSCRVSISPVGGAEAWSAHSRRMAHLPVIDGPVGVEFAMPHSLIGGGDYAVHAEILDAGGARIHQLREAASFSVDALPRTSGVVGMDCESVTVEPL